MNVRNPTEARIRAIPPAARRMPIERISSFSTACTGPTVTGSRGSSLACIVATMNSAAPGISASALAMWPRPVSGPMTIAATTPAITPSLELASTSSSSVRTTSGTSADFETEYVFCRTIIPNTRGNSRTLSTLGIISSSRPARTTAVSWMTKRRPPGTRSSHGPISGATMANGATEISWNSRTLLRAASGLLMNTEPTSTAAIAQSPAASRACTVASRRNGGTCACACRAAGPAARREALDRWTASARRRSLLTSAS